MQQAKGGSSPRPWGTRPCRGRQSGLRRFIPTPVGNTPLALGPWTTASVHPHARGEHTWSRSGAPVWRGSSPRPWGTRKNRPAARAPPRFIPTPVGNTARLLDAARFAPVHPHARGEHYEIAVKTTCGCGSSPRPWGTLEFRAAAAADDRFIPTPVGNTAHEMCVMEAVAVHPHARGEHRCSAPRPASRRGSSPRPWGTPALQVGPDVASRFIPTPVGNTTQRRRLCWHPTVHPHARGEHTATAWACFAVCGSSPRPWGTRVCGLGDGGQRRFIPTPVGNT